VIDATEPDKLGLASSDTLLAKRAAIGRLSDDAFIVPIGFGEKWPFFIVPAGTALALLTDRLSRGDRLASNDSVDLIAGEMREVEEADLIVSIGDVGTLC
jgi:hypothetical protein